MTSAKIADGAVGSAAIASGAVDTSELATDAVTQAKVASGAIGTTELASDAVTAAKVAENAITPAALNVAGNGTNGQFLRSDGDGSMSWANVSAGGGGGGTPADGSITTAKLANGAVSNAKIANDAVTAAKVADNAIGAPALNVSGNGTAGQFLRSDGDGSMTWASVSGGGSGGGPTLGTAVTPNAGAEAIDFTGIPSTVNSIDITMIGLSLDRKAAVTDDYQFGIQLGTSGGLETDIYGGRDLEILGSVRQSYVAFSGLVQLRKIDSNEWQSSLTKQAIMSTCATQTA